MKRYKKSHPLREVFDSVFTPARLATRDEHTRKQYDLNLRRFDEFLTRPATLADLNDATINSAIAWFFNNGGKQENTAEGLSAGSIDKFRDNLCTLWRYLNQVRVVDTYPSVPAVIVPKRAPIAWTPEQLTAMWEGLARIPGEIAGVPANLWWLTLHCVFLDSAERVGAVLQTEWSDIDLSAGWITVRAESRKGNRADKVSKLHDQTKRLLKRAMMPRRQLVWPWPYDRPYLWVVYKSILKAIGLPYEGRDRSFHAMRKSCATLSKLAGLNPSDVLGHLDPKQVERYIDERICPPPMPADHIPRPSTFGVPETPSTPADQAKLPPPIRIYKEGQSDVG